MLPTLVKALVMAVKDNKSIQRTLSGGVSCAFVEVTGYWLTVVGDSVSIY